MMKKLSRFIASGSVFTALVLLLVVPAKADSEVYDIRQARTGLASNDAITAIVDTLEGKYSSELETEVVNCIRNSFNTPGLRTVRIVSADEFRRAAFPDLTPEQVLAERWDQRLTDPAFREQIALLGLRYLVAVTVSEGNSLPESKGGYWEWQRFAVVGARVVDLDHSRVAGKVTASVRQTSRANSLPDSFENPSFVEGQACNEFGNAVVKFIMSEETPPQVIMSSLTLENIFPQRQREEERIYVTANGNRSVYLNTVTLDKVPAPRIPKSLLLGQVELAQFVEKKGTPALEKPDSTEIHEVAAASRWKEVRPLIKGRKELVVYEDGNAQWPTRAAASGDTLGDTLCHEIKLSLNSLTLNTQALPPLPSRWHLVPLWVVKFVSLPMQLITPNLPLLLVPPTVLAALYAAGDVEAVYKLDKTVHKLLGDSAELWAGLANCAVITDGKPANNSKTLVTPNSNIQNLSISTEYKPDNIDIHDAAATGDSEKVRSLIQGDKDLVSAKNRAGLTPLYIAASNGHRAVVEVLLDYHAEINSGDWQGATSPNLSAKQGHKDIVDLLRQYGAKDLQDLGPK